MSTARSVNAPNPESGSSAIQKRMDVLILASRRGNSQLNNAKSNEENLINILKMLKEQSKKRNLQEQKNN